MSFLPLVGPILGGLGSIFGAVQQGNDQSAAAQATAGQNAINQKLLDLYGGQQQIYNQDYLPLVPGLSGAYNSLISGADQFAPGSQIGLEAYLQNPGSDALWQTAPGAVQEYGQQGQAGLAGTPAYQEAASYYSNPGGTNLAGISPFTLGLYGDMAAYGLTPEAIGAAYQPLEAQTAQSIANVENSLGAGLPNAAGTAGDIAFRGLGAVGQVGGELAQQEQGAQLQGLRGLTEAATGLDAQTLNMLGLGTGLGFQNLGAMDTGLAAETGLAGQLDAQTLQMLSEAYNIPMSTLTSGQGFVNQGLSFLPSMGAGLSGLSNQYATAAGNAAAAASSYNPFASLSSTLAQWAPMMPQRQTPSYQPATDISIYAGGGGGMQQQPQPYFGLPGYGSA